MSKLTILIADDQPVMQAGLEAFVQRDAQMDVVATAADGSTALAQVHGHRPAVVLLDACLPMQNGTAVAETIKTAVPQTRILMLVHPDGLDVALRTIRGHADGYLLSDFSAAELNQAIRDAAAGRFVLHSQIGARLMQTVSDGKKRPLPDSLTDREEEILRLVAQGWSNQEMADRLVVSERTVRTHVSNILEKLDLSNRTQAALYALRQGIATLD